MASPLQSLAVIPSGPLPTFINVDDKYKCPICRQVLQNAWQTTCGHHVCELCINTYLEDKDPAMCPVGDSGCDMLSLTDRNIFPDISVRREVSELLVLCSNQTHGCMEAVAWKQLQDHERKCPHAQVDCSYVDYGCDEKVSRVNLQRHLEQCSHRPIECQHCGTKIAFASMQKHTAESCPKVVVTCPYHCNTSDIIREKLAEHKTSCTHRPQKCFFNAYGCQYQGMKQELAGHNKSESEAHIEMLATVISRVDLGHTKLSRELEDVKKERDHYKCRLKQAEITMEKMSGTIIDLEKQIKHFEKDAENQKMRLSSLEVDMKSKAKATVLEAHSMQLEDHSEQLRQLQHSPIGMTFGAGEQDLYRQVSQCERQLGLHDVSLAQFELRLQLQETAMYNGILMWKIKEYSRRKRDAISGRVLSVYSQPFYTSKCGYKMCARVYLNGDGTGKGTHLSFFFALMKGDYDSLLPWPFKQKVTLMLLDQVSGEKVLMDSFKPDANSSSFMKPTKEMNVASGCPNFVSHSVLEGNTYIKDDTLFLKVAVDTTDLYGP